MSGWARVFRKELREFTRDRRILMSALLGPVLLEVFILVLFGFLAGSLSEAKSQKILVVNREEGSPVLALLQKADRFEIKELTDIAKADQSLKERKARLVLHFPRGFLKEYERREAPTFFAIVDPNEATSEIALSAVASIIEKERSDQAKTRMRAMKLDPKKFDPFVMKEEKAKTGEPFAGAWLAGFLPYLIVIWAFYGGFAIVGDLVAGEKERGSLETLLVAPISRSAIAFGKFSALACVSLASCLSALLGVIITGVVPLAMTEKLFEGGLSMSILSGVAIASALLPLVVFFAGSLLAVSTFARNQREVQSYLSLLSFIVLVPAILSQFISYTDAAAAKWVAFVPVLNAATVIRDALLDKLDWYNLVVTAGVSSLIAAAGLWLAIRLFSKETVLLRV